jgi:hypothetical protein
LEAGAAENRAMLNGMNPFNLGMRAADHAGITPVQMQAADDPDPTVYKAALVELLVAADRASAEKKMVIELTRRKGDIATAQQMDHHHNADYKERRAYKDMMKSARAEFLAKWVPGVGKGRAGLPKEGSGLPADITAEVFVDRIRERCMREFAGAGWATEDNTLGCKLTLNGLRRYIKKHPAGDSPVRPGNRSKALPKEVEAAVSARIRMDQHELLEGGAFKVARSGDVIP